MAKKAAKKATKKTSKAKPVKKTAKKKVAKKAFTSKRRAAIGTTSCVVPEVSPAIEGALDCAL